MHSTPDLVVRAYWNGAVARSTAKANCWEIVRATNRRMMSPATMPLTPPDGFLQCCQSSDTHHIHILIRHCCSGEVLHQPPKSRCVLHTLPKRT